MSKEIAKIDQELDKLEINLNLKNKIIKGEISEGFKGLFRGRKNKNNINEDTKIRIDYMKDAFGDANGPLRLKVNNSAISFLESTRAIGCFSALDSGLLCYPSLQVVDLKFDDLAILVSSFELWETVGP